MIATITVIAAIAEKNSSAIAAIIRKPLSSDRSDRSDRSDNDRWDIKSSILVIVVAAIAGKCFPYDRYDRWTFFCLSDHSDRRETRPYAEAVALGNKIGRS